MKNYHPITDGMTIIHHNSIAHNVSNLEKKYRIQMQFKFPVTLRIYLPACPEAGASLVRSAAVWDLQHLLQTESDSLLMPRRTKNEYVWPDGMTPRSLNFN